MTIDYIVGATDGADLRIGIAQARFNDEVCQQLLRSCLDELSRIGVADADILVCSVPGALEVPQALLRMGRLGEFDALIALGAVIKGDTYHFEVVSNESAAGISRVSLELGIPIANAILTSYTDDQATARAHEKGAEAARVAVEMANLAAAIDSLQSQADDDARDADVSDDDAPDADVSDADAPGADAPDDNGHDLGTKRSDPGIGQERGATAGRGDSPSGRS